MNLLGAKLYDPAVAVSKATSSLLAMTAFDTANLRVAVTIPAHGMIYVRIMGGAVTGATTVPTLLLGLLNGATVIARITPQDFPGTMNAASQSCPLYAEFVVTGLTPGAMNLDLAYAVQVVVASTNIKYGGPNTTGGANAWGGISFQVWDPQPLQTNGQVVVDANGRLDIAKVSGTSQTARDLGAQLDAAVSSRMATFTLPTNFASLAIDASGRVDLSKVLGAAINALVSGRLDASVGAMAAAVITAAAHAAGAIDANAIAADAIGSSELATSAVAEIVAAVWDELTATGRTVGSFGQLLKDDINAAINSRMATFTLPANFASLSIDASGRIDLGKWLGAAVNALIAGRVDGNAQVIGTDAVDAVALKADAATEIADALLDRAAAVEALTPRQLLRLMAAALLGKASGLGTGTAVYRDLGDTKDRVTATVDSSGNRTAVVRDGT